MESSQKSFYQFTIGLGDLEKKIIDRELFCRDKNIEAHPIIFGVNCDSEVRYVVVLREFRFHFNDFLSALDAAFKIFNFFNIAFPPESLKFWSIINALFYKANNDVPITGKSYSVVQTLKVRMEEAKKSAKRSPSKKSAKRSPSRRSTSGSPARSITSSP